MVYRVIVCWALNSHVLTGCTLLWDLMIGRYFVCHYDTHMTSVVPATRHRYSIPPFKSTINDIYSDISLTILSVWWMDDCSGITVNSRISIPIDDDKQNAHAYKLLGLVPFSELHDKEIARFQNIGRIFPAIPTG
jgi:hypothetical protein